MTSADEDLDAPLAADDASGSALEDRALPTYAVRARFAERAPSAEHAERALRARLTAAHGLYDDVRVEREEDDGTWQLQVRFVVVSVDAQSAVRGVAATLADGGQPADEVWADPVPLG